MSPQTQQIDKTKIFQDAIADNIDGMVYQFIRDVNGNYAFSYVSEGINKLYGLTSDTVYNDITTVFSIIHTEDLSRVNTSIETSYINNINWNCKFRIIVNGKEKWLYGKSKIQKKADGSAIWNGVVLEITDQIKEEDENKKTLEKYKFFVDHSDFKLVTINLDFIILDATNTFPDFTKEEIIGRSIESFHEKNLWKKTIQPNYEYVLQSKKPTHFEGSYIHNDVTQTYITFVVPIFNKNNDIVQLLLGSRQTTKETNLNQINKQLTQDLNTLTNNVDAIIYQIRHHSNKPNQITHVNNKIKDFFNLSPNDVINDVSVWVNTIHPDDINELNQAIASATKDISPLNHTCRAIIKNKIKWFNFREIPIKKKNNELIWNGICVDITDQKKDEIDLHSIHKGLNNSTNLSITDANGIITYVNDNFCNLTKYNREELIGQTHNILNCGHHPKLFFKNLWKTILNGNVFFSEIKNKTKDNNTFWISQTITPTYDTNTTKPTSFLAISNVITEKKELESNLTKAEQEQAFAEEKNRLKSDFLANMSHELRTPLTSIMGYSQLLSTAENLSKKQQKFIDKVLENSDHLLNLINGLLDLSKIEAGEMSLNITENSISKHIHHIINIFKPKTDQTQHQFVLNLNHTQDTINFDETKLHQVMLNLISNAIKFSAKNSCITIKTTSSKNQLLISIEDEGPGISNNLKENLFDRFTQSKKTYQASLDNQKTNINDGIGIGIGIGTGTGTGTGLGLALCKGLVELQGGTIWLDKTYTKGAKFCFSISLSNKNKL